MTSPVQRPEPGGPLVLTFAADIAEVLTQIARELEELMAGHMPGPVTDRLFPRAYLDPEVRGAISTFSMLKGTEAALERLRMDVESGAWADRNRALLEREELDVGYRLVVSGRLASA